MKKPNNPSNLPKLGEFMREWLIQAESDYMKQSTLALYHQIIVRHIIPVIGQLPLNNVNKNTVQGYIKQKIEKGRLDGRGGLSEKTVREQVILLGTIMNSAIRQGLIYENPTKGAKLPKATQHEMRVFTLAEQKRLEYAIAKSCDASAFGITLCLYTGLRLGELCALQWGNISLELGTLTVRRTLQRIQKPCATSRTQIIIDTPKSQKSARTVPLSPLVLHKLKQYQKALPSELKQPQAYVFSQQKCGGSSYIEPRLFEKRFARILAHASIETANFHALRHTFSTRCVELGMDTKSLSEILGHSNVSITLNRYVHSFMEQKRKEISRLDAIIIA